MLVLMWVVLATAAAPAFADPITCPPGSTADPSSGQCLIIATNPGGGGSNGGGTGGGAVAPVAQQTCTYSLSESAEGDAVFER